jgi:predicted ATP-grasp superfamily ATP-dependent carboligase
MKSATELNARRFSSGRPPAVLLGGLNVLRALGLADIPVIVASDEDEAAFASRYCHGRIHLPPLGDRRAVADTLLRAGERLASALGQRIPLFYGNDDWQRLVQDYRDELAQYYLLLLNDVEVADAVIEKDRFQQLAAARGLPIPRSLEWDALASVAGPVLVKPRAKFKGEHYAAYPRLFGAHGKARIFASGTALLADAAAQQLRAELLIQEYVGGDDRNIWSFHGFADERSVLLDWFIGRKIRTYPVLTGESTYLELAHDEELAGLGQHIVCALGLKGVFKIDLKRDPRTGGFRVLEVNARYNLWHYLGAANGLNLPLTAYEHLVYGKRPAAPRSYRTTHRWLDLRMDWQAYRQLSARGELGFGGWLASLAAAPNVCELFSWDDPLPFVYRLRYIGSRLPKVARRWLSTAW